MNIALWIAQVLLAGMYGMAGSMKAFQPAKVRENPQMTWAHDKQDGYIRFVGVAELLGALGLVLPALTGILRWLQLGFRSFNCLPFSRCICPRKNIR